MEVKNKILNVAYKLFLKLGIRGVTMDDIAKEIGISKKTIYQYFEDKDSIVVGVIQNHLIEETNCMKQIELNSQNPIDEYLKGIEQMMKEVKNINPSMINDLRKYHPKAWDIFRFYRDTIFLETISSNLKRGVEEGFYRKEIKIEFLARFQVTIFELSINTEYFPQEHFNQLDVALEILDHFMHGILTENGKIIYQQHKSNIYEKK